MLCVTFAAPCIVGPKIPVPLKLTSCRLSCAYPAAADSISTPNNIVFFILRSTPFVLATRPGRRRLHPSHHNEHWLCHSHHCTLQSACRGASPHAQRPGSRTPPRRFANNFGELLRRGRWRWRCPAAAGPTALWHRGNVCVILRLLFVRQQSLDLRLRRRPDCHHLRTRSRHVFARTANLHHLLHRVCVDRLDLRYLVGGQANGLGHRIQLRLLGLRRHATTTAALRHHRHRA